MTGMLVSFMQLVQTKRNSWEHFLEQRLRRFCWLVHDVQGCKTKTKNKTRGRQSRIRPSQIRGSNGSLVQSSSLGDESRSPGRTCNHCGDGLPRDRQHCR